MNTNNASATPANTRKKSKSDNNAASKKHYDANRHEINRRKVLSRVKNDGNIPTLKSFIEYKIDYEEFSRFRAMNDKNEPVTADVLMDLRFLHASADDFAAVFGVEKEKLKVEVRFKKPANPPPEEQVIDTVTTIEVPPDVVTYKMAEDSFKRATPKNATVYSSNLRALMKLLGENPTPDYRKKADQPKWHNIDIAKMVYSRTPREIADAVDKYSGDGNKKDILSSIQNLIKWLPGYREKLMVEGADLKALTGERNIYSTASTKKRDQDTVNKTVVPFTKFLNKRRDLAKTQPYSIEHLIASLHTYIPTRRGNEFGTVRLVYNDKSKPMSADENAYDVRTGLLQIAKYKDTAARKLGVFKKVLPNELQEVIDGFIKEHEEEHDKAPAYLYGTDKPMPEAKATELFRRTFKGVLPKGEGISELRRSTRTYYVRNVKYNIEQQRQLAYDMGHTLTTALTYERQYDDPAFDEEVDDEGVVKVPPKMNKKKNVARSKRRR
jgi:hypothetical protein